MICAAVPTAAPPAAPGSMTGYFGLGIRADLRCSADRRAAGRARQHAPQKLIGAVIQRVGGQHASQHGGEAAVQPGGALCRQRLPRSAGRVCFTGLLSVAFWALCNASSTTKA